MAKQSFIKNYGLYWRRDFVLLKKTGRGNITGDCIVHWTQRGRSKQKTLRGIDFWEQKGVYVLYRDFEVVYVGRTIEGGLGKTLQRHQSNRNMDRWDRFSWFGVRAIRRTDMLLGKETGGTIFTTSADRIKFLEALLQEVIDPPYNRRHESLRGADKVEQVRSDGLPKTTEDMLKELKTDLQETKQMLNKKKP